jgi:hypothetical protein
MFGAWQSARLARAERLKPLADYLAELRPRAQSPAQMLAILRAMKASGTPMSIRKAN